MERSANYSDLTYLNNAPPNVRPIIEHALNTFGSPSKACKWLERPNPLLSGFSPIQILQTRPEQYELVEDELTRIDYGVYS